MNCWDDNILAHPVDAIQALVEEVVESVRKEVDMFHMLLLDAFAKDTVRNGYIGEDVHRHIRRAIHHAGRVVPPAMIRLFHKNARSASAPSELFTSYSNLLQNSLCWILLGDINQGKANTRITSFATKSRSFQGTSWSRQDFGGILSSKDACLKIDCCPCITYFVAQQRQRKSWTIAQRCRNSKHRESSLSLVQNQNPQLASYKSAIQLQSSSQSLLQFPTQLSESSPKCFYSHQAFSGYGPSSSAIFAKKFHLPYSV